MKEEFPEAKVRLCAWHSISFEQGRPRALICSRHAGWQAWPRRRIQFASQPRGEANSITSRVESAVNLNDIPEQAKGIHDLSVKWTGSLSPTATGDYLWGLGVDGFGRLSVDGREITTLWGKNINLSPVHLEKGHPVKLEVLYGRLGEGNREARLLWTRVNNVPDPAAVAAAKNADVVVAVVGITSRLEGEEMPVEMAGLFWRATAPASICLNLRKICSRPWPPLASLSSSC